MWVEANVSNLTIVASDSGITYWESFEVLATKDTDLSLSRPNDGIVFSVCSDTIIFASVGDVTVIKSLVSEGASSLKVVDNVLACSSNNYC